ncbi:MAG: terminase small subunit [Treponema sp.]|nr:terminase small subunit [Clostridia bacterium]MBP3607022.1 terminase small subunit [Treponema sp.]
MSKKLTNNQEKFIREYLKDFNGTRAYKEAYKTKNEKVAATSAWRMLRNVDIQQAIQEAANRQLEEVEIDVNYIVKGIKEVAERCMQKEPVEYFDKVDREWKYVTEEVELPNGEVVEARVMRFDATNALKGLELLGKYKSIFKENVNLKVDTSKKLKDVFAQIGGEGLDE